MATIRLHDNQGRDWTVEGDWSAQVIGADFDGRGQIMVWIAPDSADAHLEPAPREIAQTHLKRLIESGPPPALSAAEMTCRTCGGPGCEICAYTGAVPIAEGS